jgi:hypothetical protein
MGKKTKRNSKGKGSKNKKVYQQLDSNHDALATTSTPAILQRLRHADAKTRQAALAALLHTRFHPDSLSSKSSHSKELLQAVRDQVVLSDDLHCSIAAASCLGNYLAFSNGGGDDAATAGWLVIFITQLQEFLKHQDARPTELLWLTLTEKCTYALVYLLENNPAATDRLLAPQQTHGAECLRILTQLLQHSHQALQSTTACTTSTLETWQTIQTLAARCLHSVWDDNAEFVLPYVVQDGGQCRETMEILRILLNSNSNSVVSLHCVGAWMAPWTLLLGATDEKEARIKALLDAQISQCMLLLQQPISAWNVADAQPLVEKVKVAYTEYKAEQADNELEKDILKAQHQKQESARVIARRLKQQKDVDAAAMDNDEGETNKGGKRPHDRRDKTALWEEAVAEWHDAVRPVQLALEIVANLTSAELAVSDDDDDDDVMVEQQDATLPILPVELRAKLFERQLPESIYQLFCQLVDWSNSAARDELPVTIRESMTDLQCKAAVSLGHCLANVPEWEAGAIVQWSTLKRAAAVSDDAVQEAITSTMVAALQSRLSVRAQIGEADLDDLLTLLASASTSSPVVARDAISMLGTLCSEESHSAEVNEKVVKALLQASTVAPTTTDGSQQHPSALVLAEVLSVLMDIYGEDDCHPAVFDGLDVLGHVQRSLPLLKQRIAVEQLTKNPSPEDIEQWKETAMNAARFIQYKKGHDS